MNTMLNCLFTLMIVCREVSGFWSSCNYWQKHCETSGDCYYGFQRCNGREDCKDGSDEWRCGSQVCPENKLECPDRTCGKRYGQLCDGVVDCTKYSPGIDEQNCEACVGDAFYCSIKKTCVPSSYCCDGIFDCDTEDFSEAEDEKNCDYCVGNYAFHCAAEKKCIPDIWRCDGIYDCSGDWNSADELECAGCKRYGFHCDTDNKCIAEDNVCDGTQQCSDGQDELNCQACKNGAYFCASTSTCITGDKLCDGTIDCAVDQGDEENCDLCVGSNAFHCSIEQKCIPISSRCNNEYDCSGNVNSQDEQNCEACSNGFRCPEGNCLNAEHVCDETVEHCSNGEDELHEACVRNLHGRSLKLNPLERFVARRK